MLKKRYAVIIVLASCLVFILFFYQKNIKHYITLTKLAIKYKVWNSEAFEQAYFKQAFRQGYLKHVDKNLVLLTEKVSALLNQKPENRLIVIPPYFEHPTTMQDISNNIKQQTYNLTMLINALERQMHIKPAVELRTIKFCETISDTNTLFEIELPEDQKVINKKFIIRNNGNKKIITPRIVVNGKKKWFDLESIVQSIIKADMSNEEKALTIWNFLNNNHYHFYPATEESELHNPVKYLNAYGYGFCDDTATNFYILANRIGLKARVWGLSGHVVSEAYFNSGWHLLDSDHQVFFLKKDNKTIAGVKDLANNPELIYRVARTKESFAAKKFIGNGKTEARLYTTKEDNYIGRSWMASLSEDHNTDFSLRPGESFVASREAIGRYVSYGRFYAHVPPKYGSGQFIYTPILNNNLSIENLFPQNNIKMIEKEESLVLTADISNTPASFVIDFSTPYPITGASFEINGSMKEDNDFLKISFSKDNITWWEIDKFTGKSSPNETYNIRQNFTNYFPNGYAQPLYKYFLRFEFVSAKILSLTINNIRIITHTQLAPHSLPELENGKNTVNYRSDTSTEQSTEIEFQYSLGKKYKPLMTILRLNPPEDNQQSIIFSWGPPADRNEDLAIEYNFQLSTREDFLVPLSPNFDIETEDRKFLVAKEWLNDNQVYYWRVRSSYKDEPWGKFSEPQKLVIGTPNINTTLTHP